MSQCNPAFQVTWWRWHDRINIAAFPRRSQTLSVTVVQTLAHEYCTLVCHKYVTHLMFCPPTYLRTID